MVERRLDGVDLPPRKTQKPTQNPFFTMKNTLNIEFDPAMMTLVGAHLKAAELGRLFRALAAHMAGEDAGQHLTNSALRLAFALLGPAIDESLERLATNRANGAKGGRPRKQALPEQAAAGAVTEAEPTKKSKKEDLPPAPPIEEKNKKNNSPVVAVAESRTREELEQEIFNNDLRVEQACMSLGITPDDYRQMARAVLNDWDFTEEGDRSYKHLLNSLRIKAQQNKRQPSKHQYHEARPKTRRDITDTAAVSSKDYEGPF